MKARFAVFLLRFFALLPMPLARALGTGIGFLMWWSRGRDARNSLINVQACFPELSGSEQLRLARRSVIETAQTGVEIAAIWLKPPQYTRKKVISMQGVEVLEEALAGQEGTLILVPHLGNWEVASPCLSAFKPFTALYQPPKLMELDHLSRQGRENAGVKMQPTNVSGVKQVLKVLKEGGMSVILPDQVPPEGSGAVADFFGHPAYTMTLIHNLLRRTGCRVLLAWFTREKGGYRAHFSPLPEAVGAEDQQQSLRAMNEAIEAAVRSRPEQYQWEYKRFQKVPGQQQPINYRHNPFA